MLPPPPPLPHARAWQAGVGLPAQLHPPPHPLTPPCSPPALLPSPPPPPTPTTQPPMPPPPPPPPPRPRCLVHAAGELGGGGKDGRGAKGAKRPCRPPAPCARDNSHTAARSPVGVTHAPAPARGGGGLGGTLCCQRWWLPLCRGVTGRLPAAGWGGAGGRADGRGVAVVVGRSVGFGVSVGSPRSAGGPAAGVEGPRVERRRPGARLSAARA